MPIFTGGAILAGSLISGGLGYLAADEAADAQRDASGAAIGEQRRQFDIIQRNAQPYLNVGTGAINRLGSMYGPVSAPQTPAQNPAAGPTMGVGSGSGGGPMGNAIRQLMPKVGVRGSIAQQNGREMAFGGDNMGQGPIMAGAGSTAGKISMNGVNSPGSFMQGDIPGGKFPTPPVPAAAPPSFTNGLNVPDYSAFFASPDYQFRRDEGMRGIENSFAARGGAASGNALRALSEFNSNIAGNEFGNYFNRQAALAGIGQTATNTTANAGIQTGQNIGNALIGAGNARASGIMGGASGINSALQGGLQNWMLYNMLGRG